MLDLKLREEFRGKKLKGTMVDFTNRQGTGALDKSAEEFLNITYPSVDLLKLIEALQPGKARPVVIIGSRGQGKSHLMAALAHMYKDPVATEKWLKSWAGHLNRDGLTNLVLKRDVEVITESLHQHNYTFLWDLLFDKHPEGKYIRGKWEGQGKSKSEVPGTALFLEMFQKKPAVLILDEFQTWYEGLTNTKQHPRRNWAFNFIQILSEIAEENPTLLTLVLSVRDGDSDAAQQVYRINPVRIDFKGPQAKRDRQKLLLYRIFENRIQIPGADIEKLISTHLNEFYRLHHVPGSEQERQKEEYVQSWPFSPLLMKLLEDQVLIATQTQETRDLIRILVDVFKDAGDTSPVLTAADFSIAEEKSSVASLLDSVANQLHRDLRQKALRNYEAVEEAVEGTTQNVPNLIAILSSLWLRSLSLEKMAGARPAEIQLDITKNKPIDDNLFAVELESIKENSFNIHQKGDRLVFLNEENPQAKLMAHAKNDKLFNEGQDVEHLAQEIRYVLGGSETSSTIGRVIVLKKNWQSDPWCDVNEKDHPENWDNRIPYIVIPKGSVKAKELGIWLREKVSKHRNTIRFILAKESLESVFYDKELLILARAVYLAKQWKNEDAHFSALHVKYQKELRDQLKVRFDRFAVLDTWNFGNPDQCEFEINSHKAEGDRIVPAIHEKIKTDLFLAEDFKDLVLEAAKRNDSFATVLDQLKEPMGGGNPCIPWLGENEAKEHIVRLCARGKIEINISGRELLSSRPGETEDAAWNRMKGKIGTGRTLEETLIHEPDSTVSSGGGKTIEEPVPNTSGNDTSSTTAIKGETDGITPGGLFGGGPGTKSKTSFSSDTTSSLSLLGKLESWGITPGAKVTNVKISIESMTGAQLQDLIKKLPDGISYGLNLEKED
ncbi:DUF499 domain-containing protein [bacterium]|nr:DUF499 domain-containing protein [bacterium]